MKRATFRVHPVADALSGDDHLIVTGTPTDRQVNLGSISNAVQFACSPPPGSDTIIINPGYAIPEITGIHIESRRMIGSQTNVLSRSVLILNRSYVAVHVVSVRQACLLLYRAAAEVVDIEDGRYMNYDFDGWRELSAFKDELGESSGDWIQLIRQRLLAPRIVRLTGFDRVIQQAVRFSRRNLFARDKQRCQYCGQQLTFSQMSLDHVIPRSQGGETSWHNIVCCCVKCNTLKGGRTPRQARMQLQTEPTKPARFPLVPIRQDHPCYELWQTFLPKRSPTTRLA